MIGRTCHPRRPQNSRLMATMVVWAAALAGTNCSDGNEPQPTEFGEYELVSINGQSLPYTFPSTLSGTVVVESASLVLAPAAAGGPTYTANVLGTVNGEPGTVLADAGVYSRSGSTITFTSTALQGFVYAGTLGTDLVTISVPGQSIGATGTIILDFRK